jgi:hypothetical protein
MLKEKFKRERDELGKFVHNSLPKLKEHFSLSAVSSNVHVIFKESVRHIISLSFCHLDIRQGKVDLGRGAKF